MELVSTCNFNHVQRQPGNMSGWLPKNKNYNKQMLYVVIMREEGSAV